MSGSICSAAKGEHLANHPGACRLPEYLAVPLYMEVRRFSFRQVEDAVAYHCSILGALGSVDRDEESRAVHDNSETLYK